LYVWEYSFRVLCAVLLEISFAFQDHVEWREIHGIYVIYDSLQYVSALEEAIPLVCTSGTSVQHAYRSSDLVNEPSHKVQSFQITRFISLHCLEYKASRRKPAEYT
jgi:hypothetical protein